VAQEHLKKNQLTGTSLEEAKRLLNADEHEACLHVLREHWLKHPDDRACIELLAALLKKVGATDLGGHLSRLAAQVSGKAADPQLLFDTGFQLIDLREYQLAAMLLTRCLELAPDDPTLNYELGFTLMSLGRYLDAIPRFEAAASKVDDFDTRLNLAACYVCTRRLERAREMVEQMSKFAEGEEQETELAHRRIVLRRLQAVNDKTTFGARDWLYVHYGTVLVTPPAEAGIPGPDQPLWNDYSQVGSKLIVLKGVLAGLGEEFEVIEFYSPLSRPLAQAFADLMDLPCESYKGPERPDRALLMMAWAGDIVGPHQSFVEHSPNRSIFAYALSTREPLPVTPDLVGCLADACAMPWDEHWKITTGQTGAPPKVEHVAADASSPQTIAARIVERARAHESDPELIDAIQEAVNYYLLRRNLIVVGAHDLFPRRPEYTAELPE